MEFTRELWDEEAFAELRAYMESVAEEDYRKFQMGLMPGEGELLGVRVPLLRDMAKKIAKGDYKSFLSGCKGRYYEEVLLEGMVIGLLKLSYEEFISRADDYTNRITGWGICDCFVSSLKLIKKYERDYFNQLPGYLNNRNPWKVRYGLVVLLNYYVKEEYVDAVLGIAARMDSRNYYVQMAQAWLVAECYVKFPEKTELLLKRGLNNETRKMAFRKILDSNRVSKEVKNRIKYGRF